MKKEIKFKRPHYKYDGTFTAFSYWGPIEDGFVSPASYSGHDFKPDEQYINMRDRKGVEVYEGDIYREYWGDLEGDVLKLVFDKADSCYCGCDNKGHLHFLPDPSNMVIIGNIHENPELL